MDICLITFRSIMPVQQAEKLLQRKGVHCSVQRTPKWMEEKGCSYSLRLRLSEAHEAVAYLKENNVPFKKVYLLTSGGRAEEIDL